MTTPAGMESPVAKQLIRDAIEEACTADVAQQYCCAYRPRMRSSDAFMVLSYP